MTTKLVTPAASTISSECPKCVTNKAGKRSCCARGGAWFNNCGDADDKQFDHTWNQGIHVCRQASVSIELSLKVIRHHAGVIFYHVSTAQPRNLTLQKTRIRSGCTFKDDTTNLEGYFGLSIFSVFMCVLIVISSL